MMGHEMQATGSASGRRDRIPGAVAKTGATHPAAICTADPSSASPKPLMCVCVATRCFLTVLETSSIRISSPHAKNGALLLLIPD